MSYLTVENYFTLFGLTQAYNQERAKIKTRYLELQKMVHPDNFADATAHEKMLAVHYAATVNEAYQTLCDPLKRAIYLLKLEGIDTQNETDLKMPTEFLMEQMAFRERLEVAEDNPQEITSIKNSIEEAFLNCQQDLILALEKHPKQLSEAALCVKKMQFYARLNEKLLSFA